MRTVSRDQLSALREAVHDVSVSKSRWGTFNFQTQINIDVFSRKLIFSIYFCVCVLRTLKGQGFFKKNKEHGFH